MMSKKQWFVLLGLLIIYLLVGATFFYKIETKEEAGRRKLDKEERRTIEELLYKHYIPSKEDTQEEIFQKLATYCGKPMRSNLTDAEDPPKWDFYHSLFFVITVVTTIGYGNLAPTTSMGRIVMIFYGLIGIPINGIVMVSLGDFFGKSFVSLYRRWKTAKMEYDTTKLSLIAQIILYLVPGFTFFIFLPSVIIMVFEGWDYTLAVYYAFVTLTTIGFGDYVAGVNQAGQESVIYTIYKLFLLVWIIIGLGYVLMVLGFISSGLRSKKMHAIEHALAVHIKETPRKIRTELRALVHEFLLMKVKRVYKGEFIYTPTELKQSQSCPDLTIYRDSDSPTMLRKRALSECVPTEDLVRIQSDTDLNLIDKERTFNRKFSEQSNLLLRVANALSGFDDDSDSDKGVHCFSDEEILQSESVHSTWTADNPKAKSFMPSFKRRRAFSEVKFPFGPKTDENHITWTGPPPTLKLQDIPKESWNGRPRSRTLPIQPPHSTNFLSRIKSSFKAGKEDRNKDADIEKQEIVPRRDRINSIAAVNKYIRQTRSGRNSLFPTATSVLEETSVADFLRILADIAVPDSEETTTPPPQRKLGTASLTPPQISPPRTRRFSVRAPLQVRKGSLANPMLHHQASRRFSLRPTAFFEGIPTRRPSIIQTLSSIPPDRKLSIKASEINYATPPPAPPPYTPFANVNEGVRRSIRVPGSNRRFSLRPVTIAPNLSPVQRQVLRSRENASRENKETKDDSKDVFDEKL